MIEISLKVTEDTTKPIYLLFYAHLCYIQDDRNTLFWSTDFTRILWCEVYRWKISNDGKRLTIRPWPLNRWTSNRIDIQLLKHPTFKTYLAHCIFHCKLYGVNVSTAILNHILKIKIVEFFFIVLLLFLIKLFCWTRFPIVYTHWTIFSSQN